MAIKRNFSIWYFIILIFLSSISVSASTINDTIFFSINSNSTIYVNESITFNIINLTDDWLEIYNLTNAGNFTNINETYDAYLHLFNLVNAEINYSNTSHLTEITGDYNITLGTNEYVYVYNNYSATTVEDDVTPPSSGSGSTSNSPSQVSSDTNSSAEESSQTNNSFTLNGLQILDDELCTMGDKLKFRPVDENGTFVLVNETTFYINNSKKDFEVGSDVEKGYYYINLNESAEGYVEIKIIVNQNGHTEQAIKSLKITSCENFKSSDFFENIKENAIKYKFYLIIFSSFIIGIVVIIFSIKLSKRFGNWRKQILMIRAENFVEKARKKGYNDLQIRGMFKQKKWEEEDIDKIIKAK